MMNIKTALKRTAEAAGFRIESTRYVPRQLRDPTKMLRLEFAHVACRMMMEQGSCLSFMQIGGFDGVTSDPLRPYIERCGWRGIIVEPQPEPVRKLRHLYRDNTSIHVIEAAISDNANPRNFFSITGGPEWVTQLGSFERNSILKHRDMVPEIEQMIVEFPVACKTFDDLLKILPSPDILQMDAEGYDYKLLLMFPFDQCRPKVIQWEIKHFTMKQREDCLDLLSDQGYRFAIPDSENMLAVNYETATP